MSLSVELTPEESRRLDAVAARSGRSKSELAHEAIIKQLDDLEDNAWATEVKREWDGSDKRTRPLSELRDELGL